MQLVIKGTRIVLAEAERDYVDKKIFSLNKLLTKAITVRVELEKTTNHHKKGEIFRAEVNVDLPPKQVLRAEAFGSSLTEAVDRMQNEIKLELIKNKDKQISKDKGRVGKQRLK
ncbi:MAG: ribosome-associated translation inhibitor RaiA [Candidatus Buchananbacteria bacterium]